MNLAMKSQVSIFIPLALWIIWGYNFLAMKIAVFNCDPLLFCVLRTGIATIAFAIICYFIGGLKVPKNWLYVGIAGVFQIGLLFGFSTLALHFGNCSEASVLSLLAPLWVLVINRTLFSEKAKGIHFICLFLALAGIVVLFNMPLSLEVSLSKILSLMAGISLAIGLVLSKSIKMDNYHDLLMVCTWQMFFGNIALTLLMLMFGNLTIDINVSFITTLFYSSFIAGCFAWFLWFFILRNTSPFLSSATVFAVPVVVVILSSIHFNENIRANEWLGIILILSSLGILWLKDFYFQRHSESARA